MPSGALFTDPFTKVPDLPRRPRSRTTGAAGAERLRSEITTLQVWVRPWSTLRLHGAYSETVDRLPFLPNADSKNLQAGVTYRLGRLVSLSAGYFEYSWDTPGSPLRVNSGFRFGVSSRLAGWLPVATGPQRRGTIR